MIDDMEDDLQENSSLSIVLDDIGLETKHCLISNFDEHLDPTLISNHLFSLHLQAPLRLSLLLLLELRSLLYVFYAIALFMLSPILILHQLLQEL